MSDWLESLRQPLSDLAQRGLEYLPRLLGALLLVAAGWLVASLVRLLAARALARLNRLVSGRRLEEEIKASGVDRLGPEAVSLVVFWLVFLLFLSAAGEVLGLSVVTTGLSRLAQYLPNILGTVLVVLAGVVLANVAFGAISRAATSAGLDYGGGLARVARVAILAVATIIGLDQLGVDSALLISSTNILIAAVVGGLSLAFALGSRTAVSNLLARHHAAQVYRVGQRIRLGDIEGEIVEFTRTGVVVVADEGRVLIPALEFSEKQSTLLDGSDRE